MNQEWTKEELEIILALGPHLSRQHIAAILNDVFDTDRSYRSIRDKLYRNNVRFVGENFRKAIQIAKAKSLPGRVIEVLVGLEPRNTEPPSEESCTSYKNVEFQEKGNYATLEKHTTTSPRNLEQLLSVCEIDTSVWAVDHYIVNKWDTNSRSPQGEVETVPAYQVKVWLVRKTPTVCTWPVVAPIQLSGKQSSFIKNPPTIKKNKLKRALIIPDSQNGYRRDLRTGYLDPMHDRLSWDIVCQVAEHESFDEIILLGDMLDLPDWSDKFIRTPDLFFTTQPALLELHWWIARLARTKSKITYLEGNHEDRMRRAIVTNTMAAYDIRPVNEPAAPPIVSIENFLSLKDLGVTYISPYKEGEFWLNDNLRISHGDVVRSKSGKTAEAVVREARCSEIFGHIHRIEMATKTVYGRNGAKQYVACSPGTLARLDAGVVPGTKARNNWQNGFAVVEYEQENGYFDIHPVQIIRGRAIYKSNIWIGEDKTKLIAQDTRWDSFLKK
jgi:hypothetical protein